MNNLEQQLENDTFTLTPSLDVIPLVLPLTTEAVKKTTYIGKHRRRRTIIANFIPKFTL